MINVIKRFKKFVIDPNDVIERISLGGGPGGQSVNKTSNCVNLLHKPTGIIAKVHDTRDQSINKHIAWKRLQEKVEFHLCGEDSKIARRRMKIKKKKDRHKRKYLGKHEKKEEEGTKKEKDLVRPSEEISRIGLGDISEGDSDYLSSDSDNTKD